MGKRKTSQNVGRSLIKDRFKGKRQHHADTHLHTTELNDGYDWNRLNLQSVTEQNTLDEFLATAELAGTEFQAEKLNIAFIDPGKHTGLLTKDEEKKILETQEQHKELLRIPRRPSWNENTSAGELDEKERDSFLKWRRDLAELQDIEGLVLTPFERNLDFWRQLWRVIERSDVVVQIVDGRNPVLFRCEDLEVYVKEIDPGKVNMLLINKADFLSEKQRQYWVNYFNDLEIRVCFWSAAQESLRNQAENEEISETTSDTAEENMFSSDDDSSDQESVEEKQDGDTEKVDMNFDTMEGNCDNDQGSVECKTDTAKVNVDTEAVNAEGFKPTGQCDINESTGELCGHDNLQTGPESTIRNSANILNGDELIEYLVSLHTGEKYLEGVTTIGLIGYPNVGKSSTINAILQTKKVPVSATPGRTKHFQTLYVDKTVMLCDCPGLVMPTFVSTKAEMIVSGILPIDQMRDYVPPVSLVSKYIPRDVLETTYGFLLPKPNTDDGEDPDRLPTAHELLTAHACMRGFMTHKGVPDFQRSARVLLKDFVNGKLLYCHVPPTATEVDFSPVGDVIKPVKQTKATSSSQQKPFHSSVDKEFFSKAQRSSKAGVKGVDTVAGFTQKATQYSVSGSEVQSPFSSQTSIAGKSWKKHGNRNKKEKLRRKFKHLDVYD